MSLAGGGGLGRGRKRSAMTVVEGCEDLLCGCGCRMWTASVYLSLSEEGMTLIYV